LELVSSIKTYLKLGSQFLGLLEINTNLLGENFKKKLLLKQNETLINPGVLNRVFKLH